MPAGHFFGKGSVHRRAGQKPAMSPTWGDGIEREWGGEIHDHELSRAHGYSKSPHVGLGSINGFEAGLTIGGQDIETFGFFKVGAQYESRCDCRGYKQEEQAKQPSAQAFRFEQPAKEAFHHLRL